MSVHVRLIGLAPLGMSDFVMQRAGEALRQRHLGQLDVIDLPGDPSSPGTPRERCAVEKLLLDEHEAEALVERAGIELAMAGAPSGPATPAPMWFEVHLLMKMARDSARPGDEGAFNDVCRLIVQRMPNVHLWHGCFGDETYEYVHLAPWEVEGLPQLPFAATGPGTRRGDAVLMLLRGSVVRHPPGPAQT